MSNQHATPEWRITSVTVFRDAALVRRVAVLSPEGPLPSVVRAPGLPLSLEDSSVRAWVQTAAGAPLPVSVAETTLGLERVRASDGPDSESPQRALRVARNAEERAGALCERWRAALGHIKALQPPERPSGAPGEAPPSSPLAGRLALVAFRRQQLERGARELERAERALRDAHRSRVQLQAQQRLRSDARAVRLEELRKCATLRLQGEAGDPAAGPVQAVIEYLVPGALWAPSYVLRFAPDLRRVVLELRARVAQRSGEDWEGVGLRLSTAEAQRFCELPELPSRRIGRNQPPPGRSGWRALPEGAEALWEGYDRARAAAQARAVPEPPPPQGARPQPRPGGVDSRDPAPVASPRPRCEPHANTVALSASAVASQQASAAMTRAGGAPPPPAAPPGGLKAKSIFALGRRSRSAPEEECDDGDEAFGVQAGAIIGGLPSTEASVELLDYAALRMPAADATGRGRLQRRSDEERAAEMTAGLGPVEGLHGALLAAAGAARRHAGAVSALPLRGGLVRPEPVDAYDHAYLGQHPVDVPSDGALHSVPLIRADAPCSVHYVSVPRESADVFRSATFSNPLDAPLPQGPADVYVGGDFLLSARLRTAPGAGKVVLGLGVEPAIEVARTTRFTERSAGLLGGDLELEHEVNVEIRSHMSRPASIEVRERVPVPRQDDRDVSVDLSEVRPPWQELEQEQQPLRGGHRWTVELAPGELRTLWTRYVVRLSAKDQLVGGNRREG